jgi:RNA polymerase sigma factor (sigma-70 family)
MCHPWRDFLVIFGVLTHGSRVGYVLPPLRGSDQHLLRPRPYSVGLPFLRHGKPFASFRSSKWSTNPRCALGQWNLIEYGIYSTIFSPLIRLQEWMKQSLSMSWMADQDQRISEAFARGQGRLRNFIRKRVTDTGDAEDILQDVFYELVEAYRAMAPVEHTSAWLFRVARNKIIDLFRKKKPGASINESVIANEDDESLVLEDLLPSPDAGPEAAYARAVLLEELELALDELPDEQREIFVAHEIEGLSFEELAATTGLSVNTLLSRKHYAVIQLRQRLQAIHDEFTKR